MKKMDNYNNKKDGCYYLGKYYSVIDKDGNEVFYNRYTRERAKLSDGEYFQVKAEKKVKERGYSDTICDYERQQAIYPTHMMGDLDKAPGSWTETATCEYDIDSLGIPELELQNKVKFWVNDDGFPPVYYVLIGRGLVEEGEVQSFLGEDMVTGGRDLLDKVLESEMALEIDHLTFYSGTIFSDYFKDILVPYKFTNHSKWKPTIGLQSQVTPDAKEYIVKHELVFAKDDSRMYLLVEKSTPSLKDYNYLTVMNDLDDILKAKANDCNCRDIIYDEKNGYRVRFYNKFGYLDEEYYKSIAKIKDRLCSIRVIDVEVVK